jgi:hypothetical protein
MRKHTLTSICGGLILATISIGALHSDVGVSMEIVNRTHKGDRMPLAQVNITRPLDQPIAGAYDLADGCDPLVSSLTHSQLARVAARCLS